MIKSTVNKMKSTGAKIEKILREKTGKIFAARIFFTLRYRHELL
jgi:hypothetical protein